MLRPSRPPGWVYPRSSMILRWYLIARSLRFSPYRCSSRAIVIEPSGSPDSASTLRMESIFFSVSELALCTIPATPFRIGVPVPL